MNPRDDNGPGLEQMPLFDFSAPPVPDRSPPAPDTDPGDRASIRDTARRRRLRARFLRAGREALDDRELLELLLSRRGPNSDAGALAAGLLEAFGTAPRVLAARPDRLRSVPGLAEDAIAVFKAAEALGIAMAREAVPDTVHPTLNNYRKVIDYCRTLAGHREVEEFHLLFVNRRNQLIADELHQQGTVSHTPAYPRQICIRALELQATAIILSHNHPAGCPEPSKADIDTTGRIRDALKTIEVTLLDHVIVTPDGALSFRERGLL